MYVEDCIKASALLDTVIARLRSPRFPLPITVRQTCKPTSVKEDLDWTPQIIVSITVVPREGGERRDMLIHMPLQARWRGRTDLEVVEDYLRTVYTAVRQAVLHELAECVEYDGRLLDDPHEEHLGLLRPERDDRFQPDRGNNPLEFSKYGY